MSKLHQQKLREQFRPKLQVSRILAVTKQDPNYLYKAIRFDEHYDPASENIDKYLDRGWEIVSSDEKLADDRTNAPGKQDTNDLRIKPVTQKGKMGAEFVVIKIRKDVDKANRLKDKQKEEERFRARTQVKKQGNNEYITGTEISNDNLGNSSEQ
jgi:hypothetical protein